PGILWPKFEDQTVGLKLALIGSIKDEIMNTEELALELIKMLEIRYPHLVSDHYGLGRDMDQKAVLSANPEVAVLEEIARARGAFLKGGETDYLKTANILLENFRNAKIGRISLESPKEIFSGEKA
ncbi:MAG: hypothetical protein IKF90_08945, partial [Parasporobacterium sp.]|nr:hypothetical protein [Parasporobacterium sp.]